MPGSSDGFDLGGKGVGRGGGGGSAETVGEELAVT